MISAGEFLMAMTNYSVRERVAVKSFSWTLYWGIHVLLGTGHYSWLWQLKEYPTSVAHLFPDVAALMDLLDISRSSAVHLNLQTLAAVQASTAFSQD